MTAILTQVTPPPTSLGWEIDTLRQMRQLRDDGLITEAEFARGFQALDRSIGVPCARCRDGIAVVKCGGRNLCAPCYGEVWL